MPRPHAIEMLNQDCPTEDVYLTFGDGSIYKYPVGRAVARSIRAAVNRGDTFNLPGIRRNKWRPGPGYERVEEVPAGALVLFEDPPYIAAGDMPECPSAPAVLHVDADLEAWVTSEFPGCYTVDFTQDDPDNYTGGTCLGPAFLTNFGPHWRLNANWGGGDMSFDSDSTDVLGPYNLVSVYFGTPPPANWFFITGPG